MTEKIKGRYYLMLCKYPPNVKIARYNFVVYTFDQAIGLQFLESETKILLQNHPCLKKVPALYSLGPFHIKDSPLVHLASLKLIFLNKMETRQKDLFNYFKQLQKL